MPEAQKSTTFLTKTRIALLLAIYSPFFGYSYLKGYLHGAGFSNPNIDASPQELILQAVTALVFVFSRLANLESYAPFAAHSLKIGIIFAVALSTVYLITASIKNSLENKGAPSKIDLNDVIQKLFNWLFDKPKVLLKTIISAISGFVFGFSISYIAIFLFIFSLAFLLSFMILGNLIGESRGKKLTKADICVTKEWDTEEYRRVGCNTVVLKTPYKGSSELAGLRLYTSEDTIYLLTNEGAYEIGDDLTVKIFTPIQIRTDKK